MTDDLVQFLSAEIDAILGIAGADYSEEPVVVYGKAKDRIEALTAQLEAMKEAHDDVEQYARRHCAEVEALTAQLQAMQGHIDHADAYRKAMEAAAEERDAMKNIAYAAGYYQAECGLPEHENASAALVELKQTKAEIDRLRAIGTEMATAIKGNYYPPGVATRWFTALKGQQP